MSGTTLQKRKDQKVMPIWLAVLIMIILTISYFLKYSLSLEHLITQSSFQISMR